MSGFSRAAIPPYELSIEMDRHWADILHNVFGEFESSRENIFWLWQQFCEEAVQDFGLCGKSLAGGEKVRCVTIANHTGQEERAARLHRKSNSSERETEFGFGRR